MRSRNKSVFLFLSILLYFNALIWAEETLRLPEEMNIVVRRIEFRDTELVDVLQGLSGLIKLNVIISPLVIGKVNLLLDGVKIEDAFNSLFQAQGLAFKWNGNILTISPNPNFPLVTQTIQLRNRKVEEIEGLLWGMQTQGVGTFSLNTASNSISFTDRKEIVWATALLLGVHDYFSGTIGEFVEGKGRFIQFDDKSVTFGPKVLTVKIESAKNASHRDSIYVYMQGDPNGEVSKIGEYSYDSFENGSGTSHPIEINCNISISARDKQTGEEVKLTPK